MESSAETVPLRGAWTRWAQLQGLPRAHPLRDGAPSKSLFPWGRRPYPEDMSGLSDLDADERLSTVELETDEGREAVIYGPDPKHAVRGVTFVPLELLAAES